jgi:hypothetical protein
MERPLEAEQVSSKVRAYTQDSTDRRSEETQRHEGECTIVSSYYYSAVLFKSAVWFRQLRDLSGTPEGATALRYSL